MARGTAAEQADILTRQLKAIELRTRGYSYRAIGEQLKVSHVQAYRDVSAELKRLTSLRDEKLEELRELELQRLDRLLHKLDEKIEAGQLTAMDRALRIMERRARLLGLDAPERRDLTTGGEAMTGLIVNLGDTESDEH